MTKRYRVLCKIVRRSSMDGNFKAKDNQNEKEKDST